MLEYVHAQLKKTKWEMTLINRDTHRELVRKGKWEGEPAFLLRCQAWLDAHVHTWDRPDDFLLYYPKRVDDTWVKVDIVVEGSSPQPLRYIHKATKQCVLIEKQSNVLYRFYAVQGPRVTKKTEREIRETLFAFLRRQRLRDLLSKGGENL